MKKLILFCSAFIAIAAVVITVTVKAQSKPSALLLANIEALTQQESADLACNIWEITANFDAQGNFIGSSCSTGGEYACVAGECQ